MGRGSGDDKIVLGNRIYKSEDSAGMCESRKVKEHRFFLNPSCRKTRSVYIMSDAENSHTIGPSHKESLGSGAMI